MLDIRLAGSWLGVVVLAAAAAVPAAAQQERVLARDGITYVSGGIGEAEQQQLLAREKDYNLKLVFTLIEGNYVADVNVVLSDVQGKKILEHFAGGPIFLAKLPAGMYSASVSYNGKVQSRPVKVSERLRTEYFRWPATPEADLPVSRWLEPETEPKPKAGARRR